MKERSKFANFLSEKKASKLVIFSGLYDICLNIISTIISVNIKMSTILFIRFALLSLLKILVNTNENIKLIPTLKRGIKNVKIKPPIIMVKFSSTIN